RSRDEPCRIPSGACADRPPRRERRAQQATSTRLLSARQERAGTRSDGLWMTRSDAASIIQGFAGMLLIGRLLWCRIVLDCTQQIACCARQPRIHGQLLSVGGGHVVI